MHTIFFTNTFISLRLSVYSPSIQSHCFSMTAYQRLVSITFPSKTPLLFMCPIVRVPSVESSSREEKHGTRIGYFNFGNSRSLVDSHLDCRAHEVTLTTHNRDVYGQNIRDVRTNIVMEYELPSHEQLRSVLVQFPAEILLPWLQKVLHLLHDDLLQQVHTCLLC